MSGSRSHSSRMADRYFSYLTLRNWAMSRPKWYNFFAFCRWVKNAPNVLDFD